MINHITVLPATNKDRAELETLRSTYISFLYQGYNSSILSRILPHKDFFTGNDNQKTLICSSDGIAQGFITICGDPDHESCGLISDLGLRPDCDDGVRYSMMQHAVKSLREMGYGQINMMLLRENFRVRFVLEQFGFRCNHAIQSCDEELDGKLLLYSLPANKNIHP